MITAEKCLKCKCLCTPASLLRDSRKEEPSFFWSNNRREFLC